MAVVYVPRSPTTGELYGVVRTHLPEFLLADTAAPQPAFRHAEDASSISLDGLATSL